MDFSETGFKRQFSETETPDYEAGTGWGCRLRKTAVFGGWSEPFHCCLPIPPTGETLSFWINGFRWKKVTQSGLTAMAKDRRQSRISSRPASAWLTCKHQSRELPKHSRI